MAEMKTIIALVVACALSSTVNAPKRESEIDWNALRTSIRGNVPARFTPDAKARWFKAESKRAFGAPGSTRFRGLGSVTSIEERDGKWLILAKQIKDHD